MDGIKKYLILFNQSKIIYCGQYIDSEVTKKYIQIYSHVPNIFNVGGLLKCDFESGAIENKAVNDHGYEHKQLGDEFGLIYFLEAIKCGRVKYAYNKLSYELKTAINIDALANYFEPFDKYFYLHEQDVYITLKNNKVTGVYHFVVKDNLIDNIY